MATIQLLVIFTPKMLYLFTAVKEGLKMKKEELKRFFEFMPRTGVFSVLLFLFHKQVKRLEIEPPSQPLSRALAYASVGYVFCQIVHAFVRAKYPHNLLFDIFSLICGFVACYIALLIVFYY